MAVLKSKRKESQFEVFHFGFATRKELTIFLMRNFGMREIQPEWIWFVEDEKRIIMGLMRTMLLNISMANSIFPTNLRELEERRIYQDKAIGNCNQILCELQFALETLPADINKFTRFANMMNHEISLLKGWRKADNKFKKTLG